MSDYRDTRRWFLREGGPSGLYVEVDQVAWMQAEWNAGFRGGRAGEPSTEGFEVGGVKGVITYGKEGVPAGAVELTDELPTVTYEWGHQLRATTAHRWGAVRESYEDNYADAETRARAEVNVGLRMRGPGTARLVRARIERYGWEEVPNE